MNAKHITKKPIRNESNMRKIDWIKLIKQNNQKAISNLYDHTRQPFLSWASRKFTFASEEDLQDAYQEAFIQLYINIREEKLTELWSQIQVYLFAIGKNLLRKKYKTNIRMNSLDDLEEWIEQKILFSDPSVLSSYLQENHIYEVKSLLAHLTEEEQQLIRWIYYDGISLKVIAERMGIDKEVSVRVKKHRIMKQLKALVE